MSSPAPRAKDDCRWKERRIGWEIHIGDYGWRLRVGSQEMKGGCGGGGGLLRCLIDMNKMKWEKKGVVGQEEMTEVN